VVSAQPVNGFATFTLGFLSPAVNPLATQLLTFTADQPTPGSVDLEWMLTSEDNAYGYAVERSANNISWQRIGFVASQGITSQLLKYTYQDQSVRGLTQAYYRLRQTNAAGMARYSSVVSVAIAGSPLATVSGAAANQFAVFPNPASSQVTVRLSTATSGLARVQLNDLSGRMVLTQTLRGGTDTEIKLPASLSAGVYLLRVQAPGYSGKPQRLVIQ